MLPFDNAAADAASEYISDGITETLIRNLAQLSGLRVMARSTVFRYKGSNADPRNIGRELNVGAVLTGRILQRDDTLLVSAELVDVANGWQLWSKQYDRKAQDILSVQDEIAREISEHLSLSLSRQEKKRLAKRQTQDTEAYHLYLKGTLLLEQENAGRHSEGSRVFQAGHREGPGFCAGPRGPGGFLSSAVRHRFRHPASPGRHPATREAALRALQIDDALAEAHCAMASLLQVEWDWAGAEREYKRAIELDSRYATVHHWYAFCLIARRRVDEAIQEAKLALELDPLSISINRDLALIFLYARQPDRAIEQYEKTIELDPTFALAHQGLGRAYLQRGMHQEAIRHLRHAAQLSGDRVATTSALAHAYAIAGDVAGARTILEKLLERSTLAYVPPSSIAVIHVGLGDYEKALAWLDKAYAEGDEG